MADTGSSPVTAPGLVEVKATEVSPKRDWNNPPVLGEKSYADTELARFQYYDGKNPDWPMKILQAEYQNALNDFLSTQSETRDVLTLIEDNAGVQFVNVSMSETRNLIVQAGAFAEHEFVSATHADQTVPVDSKHLAVQLPPGTSIRLDLAMRRFGTSPRTPSPGTAA